MPAWYVSSDSLPSKTLVWYSLASASLSQDRPLYRGFTVAEMLTVGKKLNPRWDDALARRRLHHLGIPLKRKAGKLSGGQQSQLALVMALAKRPEFLLLDEPVAAFDPLARREFLSVLLEATVEDGLTVLLSSHIINDLERMCDYILILSAARLTAGRRHFGCPRPA